MKPRLEDKRPPKKNKLNSYSNKNDELQSSLKDQEFQKIQEFRYNLPIYSAREKLKQEIRNNQSLVIIGETGA